MRAQNIGFLLLPKCIHSYEVGRRRKSFHDRLKLEIQWKIQSGINADHIRAIRCGAANETSDLLFRIRDKNFTEGKEVFLPMLRANSRMEFPNNRSAYFFLCPEFLDR